MGAAGGGSFKYCLPIRQCRISNIFVTFCESVSKINKRKKYICTHESVWKCQSLQLCLTLWDPLDYSPPGSSVHGILQARILEWVAMPFSRGSSWPRDQTQVSCIAGRFLIIGTTREAHIYTYMLIWLPPNVSLFWIFIYEIFQFDDSLHNWHILSPTTLLHWPSISPLSILRKSLSVSYLISTKTMQYLWVLESCSPGLCCTWLQSPWGGSNFPEVDFRINPRFR